MGSMEVEGHRDGDRPDLVKVANFPWGTKVRQVAFTQSRMFVLSESGDVFLFRIEEILPPREDILLGKSAEPKGELKLDAGPIKIEGVGKVK